VCMGFPSLLSRLFKLQYSAGFGKGLGACLHSTVSLFAKNMHSPVVFPLGQFCVTGYVLLMVHTILYSFTLAASVFAQGSGFEGPAPFSGGLCTCKGSKVSVCMGFPSLLNRLCKLRYSVGFGMSLGGGGGGGMGTGSQFASSPGGCPRGPLCLIYH
jgi:hypothetical protein